METSCSFDSFCLGEADDSLNTTGQMAAVQALVQVNSTFKTWSRATSKDNWLNLLKAADEKGNNFARFNTGMIMAYITSQMCVCVGIEKFRNQNLFMKMLYTESDH